MLAALIIVSLTVGVISIVSACYHWVHIRVFGVAGVVLSLAGMCLFGAAFWASVQYGSPRPGQTPDPAAVHRLVDEANARTVTAVKESNKQVVEQFQQLAKQLQDNQDRGLSDIQSHILAIRTALSERPAPQPPSGTSNTTQRQKPSKAR
jgi:hypothetical protein